MSASKASKSTVLFKKRSAGVPNLFKSFWEPSPPHADLRILLGKDKTSIVHAHRIILCAYSTELKRRIGQLGPKEPLDLQGKVDASLFTRLLRVFYTGETYLPLEEWPEFAELCAEFDVRHEGQAGLYSEYLLDGEGPEQVRRRLNKRALDHEGTSEQASETGNPKKLSKSNDTCVHCSIKLSEAPPKVRNIARGCPLVKKQPVAIASPRQVAIEPTDVSVGTARESLRPYAPYVYFWNHNKIVWIRNDAPKDVRERARKKTFGQGYAKINFNEGSRLSPFTPYLEFVDQRKVESHREIYLRHDAPQSVIKPVRDRAERLRLAVRTFHFEYSCWRKDKEGYLLPRDKAVGRKDVAKVWKQDEVSFPDYAINWEDVRKRDIKPAAAKDGAKPGRRSQAEVRTYPSATAASGKLDDHDIGLGQPAFSIRVGPPDGVGIEIRPNPRGHKGSGGKPSRVEAVGKGTAGGQRQSPDKSPKKDESPRRRKPNLSPSSSSSASPTASEGSKSDARSSRSSRSSDSDSDSDSGSGSGTEHGDFVTIKEKERFSD